MLFENILTRAELKWTSSCLKLMPALVFIRKSSISCVQSHNQLSWSDYVWKHAGVAVCILLGLYPLTHLLKAVADVTKPMPNENCARMLTGHDAISSQSCLVRELHEGQKKIDYQQMWVFVILLSGKWRPRTARRIVRDVVLCMAKHTRISAVSANLCTHTKLNKKWTSRQQW